MNYKIILTDSAGTTMNARLKLPYLSSTISPDNSTWYADGAKLRRSNGACDSECPQYGNTNVFLKSGKGTLVEFYAFFDKVGLHNASGTAWILPNSTDQLVPGIATWTDAE